MPIPTPIFPDDYLPWLLEVFSMTAGDEASPEALEPLYRYQRRWVGEAGGGAGPELYDAATIRAYTLFYMSINMPKLWFMLDRAWPALEGLFGTGRRVAVADLGCGPGTLTWALLFYLRRHRPEWLKQLAPIRGIDRHEGFLEVARRLSEGRSRWAELKDVELSFEQADWPRAIPPHADLLLTGNTLAELPAADADCLYGTDARALFLVEPGTRQLFQRVLPLRDRLLADGWQIHFPCPSAHACPMAGTDNWCHFHVNRLALPFVQRMAAKAGRLNPRHHFTGFVFTAPPSPPPGSATPDWRVLSTLRRVHRSAVRWLCDGEHLVEAVLNRHAKQPHHRDFIDAAPGDLLHLEPAGQLGRHPRLAPGQQVSLVDRSPKSGV